MARTAKTNRLTALAVRKYADDPLRTAPLHDGGGLYLRKRGASLTWILRLTDPASGAQQWHRLFPDDPSGSFPNKSLAAARAEASRLWSTRSIGIDPRAERRALIERRTDEESARKAALARRISVRALFERWAATDLVPRVLADGGRLGRKDAGAFARAQFERRVFPSLGDSAAEAVKRSDLLEILDTVKAEGKLRTANVLLSDLKQMFRFALARDIVQRNPLDTVLKREVGGKSVARDRVLSRDELLLLATRLPSSGLQPRFVCSVWLILCTGVRVGELLGAVWSDAGAPESTLRSIANAGNLKLGFVDLAQRTWYLPETKNERDHTIHLSKFAVDCFQRLAALGEAEAELFSDDSSWIYPNVARTGPVGVKTLGKQLSDRQRDAARRLKARSTATNALALPGGRWTAHDLRRTCATLMAVLGISGDVIDECLNHMIESRVRRTYIRDRRAQDQARAFDTLGDFLAKLLHVSDQIPQPNQSARAIQERASARSEVGHFQSYARRKSPYRPPI